jgi:hypothetical protein
MLSNICITNNILIPGYSWNTAKIGVKHHSMNNIRIINSWVTKDEIYFVNKKRSK